MAEELTERQIENWRRVLSALLGPEVLLSAEQIQAYREQLQGLIGAEVSDG